MQEDNYRVGIYCRLSKDDDQPGESSSIGTQDFICQGEILLYSKKACVPITAHMLFQLKYQYFEAFV